MNCVGSKLDVDVDGDGDNAEEKVLESHPCPPPPPPLLQNLGFLDETLETDYDGLLENFR